MTQAADDEEDMSLDFESRGTVDLRKTGAYVYSLHHYTDLLLGAYAFGDEPPALWHRGEPCPPRVANHIERGGRIYSWNVAFERLMLTNIAARRYGWPVAKRSQYFDTAAQAAAQSLPRALDNAARAMRMRHQKDMAGHRLMLQMCKPRHWLLSDGSKLTREADGAIPIWWEEPEKIERLGVYCCGDLETERGFRTLLRPLSQMERLVYLLDQVICDRGIRLDQELVRSAAFVVAESTKRLDQEMRELTGGAVPKCSGVAALGRWLKTLGVELPQVPDEGDDEDGERDSMDKAALAKLLSSTIPDDARRAILLRQEAGKSSNAKLISMQATLCADGRMKGLFRYHGASTGRWASEKVQLQNLKKATIKNPESFIPDILACNVDRIEIFDAPLDVVSSLLRGCLVPAPGHRFLVADFAAIEARVNAWLAGQQDLVDYFASGGDPYCAMAAKIYHRLITKVDFKERQIGKALVLAAGFQMGPPKFKATAAKPPYWVDVTIDEAEEAISVYRESNDRIVALWRDMENGAFEAVRRPGLIVTVARGLIRFVVRGRFLWMVLPSGRTLAYADPFIGPTLKPWGDYLDAVRFFSVPTPSSRRKLSESDARLPGTIIGRWEVTDIFGGKWTENAVQGIARDLLAGAMLRLHKAGYEVVSHSHDEIVNESPEDFGSLDEMIEIMVQGESWSTGLPIAAEGKSLKRYAKF